MKAVRAYGSLFTDVTTITQFAHLRESTGQGPAFSPMGRSAPQPCKTLQIRALQTAFDKTFFQLERASSHQGSSETHHFLSTITGK